VKRIYSSSDSAQLGLLASRLEASGIACEVRSESQVIPGIPFGPELWILQDEDYEEAAELLSAWQEPSNAADLESSTSEASPNEDLGDGRSLASMVAALYRTISAPANGERDWDRFRALFFPGAQLLRTVADADGQVSLSVMDVEGFIRFASPYFRDHPFYEREIFRRVDQFGQIAQVFSTFDSSSDPEGKNSLGRGINSIQLWSDNQRWWVVNLLWDDERPGNPIPPAYKPR
jgi:hypothetical protein